MTATDVAIAAVNRLHKRIVYRRPETQRMEDYFAGNQPLKMVSNEWAEFNAKRYVHFADNWCGPVAAAASERISPRSIRLPSEGRTYGPLSPAEKQLMSDWNRNDMDAQASQGVLASIVARRSHVLVWGDRDDNPVMTWEHPYWCEVEYDPANPRRRRFALKTWIDDETEFATLYGPDFVWKFKRPATAGVIDGVAQSELARITVVGGVPGGWTARESDGEQWPIKNPTGEVPMVEIQNRPTLFGDPMSDIAGVASMQDAINMLWVYLFASADRASEPARVALGGTPPTMPVLNDQGQEIGRKPIDLKSMSQGRFAWLSADSIDQWDAAKLDVFTGVIETAVGHIAAQTRTPPHYLVSNKGLSNLSGDALKAAEAGLAAKCREYQLFAGSGIREIHRLGALVRGDLRVAEACKQGRVTWADVENHSEAQKADALLKKKQIGYPFAWIMQEDGLTPDEMTEVLAMVEREQRAAETAGFQAAITSALNTGTPATTNLPTAIES